MAFFLFPWQIPLFSFPPGWLWCTIWFLVLLILRFSPSNQLLIYVILPQYSCLLLQPACRRDSLLYSILSRYHLPSSYPATIHMIVYRSYSSCSSSEINILHSPLKSVLIIFILLGSPFPSHFHRSHRGSTHRLSIFTPIVLQVISQGRFWSFLQTRILNNLSSFCDMHHTPLDTSCILSYSFITQVSSTWECNQFFPLFDYIASSIRTVSVDALNTITGHHSVFDALFNIPILDLQTSNREILLQLLCECVGECMQSVLALPLLLRHQSSIQTLLQASLTSSRHVNLSLWIDHRPHDVMLSKP